MPSPRAHRVAAAALDRGAAALARNDLALAAASAGEVLAAIPGHPDGLLLHGLVLLRRGEAPAALRALQASVEADPERPAAWVNLARAALGCGDADGAATAAAEALQRRQELPEAWLVLAHAELARGRREAARAAAMAVLGQRRTSAEAWGILGVATDDAAEADEALQAAAVLAPSPARWRALAARRLGDGGDAVGALIKALELDGDDADTWRMFGDALLMTQTPPPSAWLLRALDRPEIDTALLGPLCVAAILAEGGPPHPLVGPSLQKTLWRGRDADALLARLDVPELADQAVIRGETPVVLDADVPALTPLPDSAVRAQYEESPYPWLVTAPLRQPRPFDEAIRELLPHVSTALREPDILIAGCGTGRHIRVTAGRFRFRSMLAIDLSRASLARAAEVTRDIPGLTLAQADLRLLGGTYDFVDSVGVVHHLEDPAAGVAVLRGLVRPGGFLRIGVYSERGRADVIDARTRIADLTPTPEGLREAKRRLIDHPVARSVDFWTLPGLRDLLFHPVEARYRPAQVRDLLGAVEILGVQPTHPRARAWYRERYPDDPTQAELDRWDAVEDEHPDVFGGMILVWARVP